jgi:hypothetical protein
MRALPTILAVTMLAPMAPAQPDMPSRVEIAWNRYYTHAEFTAHMRAIAQAYPDLVRLERIGESRRGREMLVAVVTSPSTGPDTSKPAMWIDGNVHGNEIQAGEAVMYTLWYLTKAYGVNAEITRLLDAYSFYLLPSVNPDGRERWFEEPHTPHSSRHSLRPVDDDRDGLFDEDPPDDLDGDGHITQMWIEDPAGRWERDRHDPRVFRRVRDDQVGQWTLLGQEGIDNDGDGQINEDGPGGDDMNRNFPSGWLPAYAQYGAGEFPLGNPETRAVARFILAHPNIAAAQSYHNAGGMILRGPGAPFREGYYPAADRRVYDEIARIGEDLLPYYRSMVLHRDLYIVHGGFINWTAEGLAIFSFTNELWTDAKYFQRDIARPDEERIWRWRDRLGFGQQFTPYTEIDHPQYGRVLVGGLNKWSSRNTPTFMLEEECHRNFAFTMYHADQMPVLRVARTEVEPLSDGVWRVTAEIRNDRLIPTRSALQAEKRIGSDDIVTCTPPPGGEVLAGGTMRTWRDRQIDEARFEPGRLRLRSGVSGRGAVIVRFVVTGGEGEAARIRLAAERAADVEIDIPLRAEPARE